MIRAEFRKKKDSITGFVISGHAGYADAGEDVVCAAVSSAVQYVLNLVDMFIGGADISVEDNKISCFVGGDSPRAAEAFYVLQLHLEMISEDYPNTIKITISEV